MFAVPSDQAGATNEQRYRRTVPVEADGRRRVDPGLVAKPATTGHSAPAFLPVRSDGQGLRLRQGVQGPRPEGREEGSAGADDQLTGLVASGLRSLRRPAALRAGQQLAGQREPRQGAPPAVADQAEIRPQNLLGRSVTYIVVALAKNTAKGV